MKQNTPLSNSGTVPAVAQDFPSFKNLESLTTGLPAAEWAQGLASIYCIIVGFGKQKPARKLLFKYVYIKSEPTMSEVKNINPYFVDAPNVVITSQQKSICDVPEIGIGNKPHYLFTTEDKAESLKIQPVAARYFRRCWIGTDDFINGYERWCLWLGEEKIEVLQTPPEIWKRVETVRQ